jgi:molybdenum cofactor synthesis domain-containing protein
VATAGIVVIGDEILTGKFADENAAFLISELRMLGVELRRIVVIPDELDDIAATVVDVAARVTYVFTSGGVGPTHDDLTMAGIARGFGTRVVRHPELEAKVRGYWGDKLAEPNLRLADVPEGAQLVYGPLSAATNDPAALWPVVSYRNVFILPGVPALFRRKFVDIRDRFRAEPMAVARAYLNAEEGEIADDLHAIVAAFPAVKVGSYPRFAEKEFRVLVTFESRAMADVTGALAMLVERLGARVVKRDEPAFVG